MGVSDKAEEVQTPWVTYEQLPPFLSLMHAQAKYQGSMPARALPLQPSQSVSSVSSWSHVNAKYVTQERTSSPRVPKSLDSSKSSSVDSLLDTSEDLYSEVKDRLIPEKDESFYSEPHSDFANDINEVRGNNKYSAFDSLRKSENIGGRKHLGWSTNLLETKNS